jgi:excisionase family DNA binding protein
MTTDFSDKSAWYSIREAADYLQIGEPTLYRWMRDNKITFRKVGDSTRFLREDLDAVVVTIRSTQTLKNNPRCIMCGSAKLVDGKCQSTGALYFTPEDTKFWTFKTSTIALKAKMCSQCGYIHSFGNTEHLKEISVKREA